MDTPPLLLTQIDPEQNRARFYTVTLTETLFGEVALLRNWGRLGTRGQTLLETHATAAEAAAAAEKLAARKRRRGYR